MHHQSQPFCIMGIELRTTNAQGRAFQDIPPFWHRFISESYLEKIQNKLNNDVYGVYTHFDNEGKNVEMDPSLRWDDSLLGHIPKLICTLQLQRSRPKKSLFFVK